MGEEAIQHCRTYALLAERRLGELLAATERAKGTRLAGRSIGGNAVIPPKDDTPTLSELGVTKRESAETLPGDQKKSLDRAWRCDTLTSVKTGQGFFTRQQNCPSRGSRRRLPNQTLSGFHRLGLFLLGGAAWHG